jgi:hypothetical protein
MLAENLLSLVGRAVVAATASLSIAPRGVIISLAKFSGR